MRRTPLSSQIESLLTSARKLALDNEIEACLLLADHAYPFEDINRLLKKTRLLVATDKPDVEEVARRDGIEHVILLHEPQTRIVQISQALLEALSEDWLQGGEKVVTLYAAFDRDSIDTVSLVNLGDQLSRLTSRDLQRLKTQVPLETLRIVVDLACEIGREGREGKSVGALFVVGNHRKVMQLSHEQVHDPFRGYSIKERMIRSPRVRESMKELAQIDGAFIISADGAVHAAGRILDAPAEGLTLSKGLGARHWAAAAISKATNSIAIAVSESTGTVRLFKDGMVVLRIEPLDRAMKWFDVETEPPPPSD